VHKIVFVFNLNFGEGGGGHYSLLCWMQMLTVMVVPLFTVVLDLNVPTHSNDAATIHCCVGSECANSQ